MTLDYLTRGSIGQISIYSRTTFSVISTNATIVTLPIEFRLKFRPIAYAMISSTTIGWIEIFLTGIIRCVTTDISKGVSCSFSLCFLRNEDEEE